MQSYFHDMHPYDRGEPFGGRCERRECEPRRRRPETPKVAILIHNVYVNPRCERECCLR